MNYLKTPSGKIRVLIVDDAAFMRKALVTILSEDKEIEIVGVAKHGKYALEAIELLNPDVITLDIDMPVMDGITALKHIMVQQPRPIIMASALADSGQVTLEALRLGAIDFFPKPSGTVSINIEHQSHELITIIKRASKINRDAIVRARWKKPVKYATKISDKNLAPEKLMVILANGGGSTSYIRFLGNVPVTPEGAAIVVQCIHSQPLYSFCSELNNHVEWNLKTMPESELVGGHCLLLPDFDYDVVSTKDKVKIQSCQTNTEQEKGAWLLPLVNRFKDNVHFFLLAGVPEDINMLKAIKNEGGQITILDPRNSISDEVCKLAIKERLGNPASEAEIWNIASKFLKK